MYKGKDKDFVFDKYSNDYDFAYDEETGKYRYTKRGMDKRDEYNKKNYASISFSMKKEDYELYKQAADAAGMKFTTWVRSICNKESAREE